MLTTIFLINVENDQVNEVAGQFHDMKETSDVYTVVGLYNLVLVVSMEDVKNLINFIKNRILKMESLQNFETMMVSNVTSGNPMKNCMHLAV